MQLYKQPFLRCKGISIPKTFFTFSDPSGDFVIIHEDIEPNFARLNTIEGARFILIFHISMNILFYFFLIQISLSDAQSVINKLALFHAQVRFFSLFLPYPFFSLFLPFSPFFSLFLTFSPFFSLFFCSGGKVELMLVRVGSGSNPPLRLS